MTISRTVLLSPVLLLSLLLHGEPRAEAEDEPKAESRMWQRLKRMDTDGDGEISREEFRGPDRLWDRLDGDGDGSVSQKEADKASEGGRGGMGRGGQGRGGMDRGGRGRGGRGGGGGLTLEKLDTNKDGSISKPEWDTFLKEADENEDQILQKEEWDAAVGGGAMKDPAPKVGSAAPKVQAQMRGLKAKVDLAAPKRTTVLIFGSWT